MAKKTKKSLYPDFSVYINWFREHIVLLVVLLTFVGVGHLVIGIKVAAQPYFCSIMCHEMTIHVDTYHQTKHAKAAKGPACMDCHAMPGFFNHLMEHVVALKFLIPHVTTPYLEDDLDVHKEMAGFNKEELDFNDKTYLEEQEIFEKCHVCHPNRAALSYFMQPTDHGRTILNSNCRRCHARIIKLAEPDKVKAKKMLNANSWTADEPKMLPNVHPLHLGLNLEEKLHENPKLIPYVEKHGEFEGKIRCTACHSRVIHSTHPDKRHVPGMRRCLRCHAHEEIAPNNGCPMCHIGPQNTFLGVKGMSVEEMESPMIDVECTDCHNVDKNYKVFIVVCEDCHDEPKNQFKTFRKKWLDSYEIATQNYEEVERYIDRMKRSGQNLLPYMKLYKRAKYNYLYAARDYSKGIHNAPFTAALFEDANNSFITLLEMLTANQAQ